MNGVKAERSEPARGALMPERGWHSLGLDSQGPFHSQIRFCFAYTPGMRDLSPVQVLSILLQRLEARADALERVRLEGFNMTICELRNFAGMVRKARDYLQSKKP